MGITKKCRFCYQITNNFLVTEEYFGQDLLVIIRNEIGIDVDAFNLKNVLICENCALSVIQTGSFLKKFKLEWNKIRHVNKKLIKFGNFNKKEKDESTTVNDTASNATTSTSTVQNATAKVERLNSETQESECNEETNEVVFKTPQKNEQKNEDSEVINEEVNFKNEVKAVDLDVIAQREIVENAKTEKKSPKKAIKQEENETTPKKKSKKETSHETPTNLNKKTVSDSDFSQDNGVDTFASLIADLSHTSPTLTTPKKRKDSIDAISSEAPEVSYHGFKKFKANSTEITINNDVDVEVTTLKKKKKKNKNKEQEIAFEEFICSHCNKRFDEKEQLLKHTTKHATETLERKQCPNCNISFRTKEKYDNHVFSKKCENANYECEVDGCSKRFSSLESREKHLLKRHPDF